jgi:hypothetical protein
MTPPVTQRGKYRVRETAIAALLSENSIEAAAQKVGLSRRTLLRWLKEPEFRARYADAKQDQLKMATGVLARNCTAAACTLEDIFKSKPEPHQGARVAAAHATLRLALDAFALEQLEQRIRQLEGQTHERL